MAGHVKRAKEDKNKKPIIIAESDEGFNYGTIIEELPVFTPNGTALTIVKVGDKYKIVSVAIDSETGLAGEVTVLDTADGKMEANEKFKLNVVKLGII